MKKLSYLILLLGIFTQQTFSQATWELTTKGITYPRYTDANRPVAPITIGTTIFNTTQNIHQYWNGSSWTNLVTGGGSGNYWQLSGANGDEILNSNSGGFWSKNISNETPYPLVPPPTNGPGIRLMWIPKLSAFRAGSVNGTQWDAGKIGLNSFAIGIDNIASGSNSTVIGESNTASGYVSFATGRFSTASDFATTAMGWRARALGSVSTAIGNDATASGQLAVAIGAYTTASGYSSTAIGVNSNTNGKSYSFAIGGASIISRAINDRDNQMKMHFDEFQFLTGTNNNFIINDVVVSTSNSLFVYGNRNYNLGGYGYLNNTAPTGLAPSANIPVSIFSAGRIAASEFDAFSDIRHKKLRSYSNGKTDLELLNQLKVSNYTFIDTVGKGTKIQMGFIAQQVEEIVPEAVNKIQDYIPSVYDMAKSMVYDASLHTLTITTFKPHDFQAKDEIKLISLDKEHKVKVDKIMDANTFIVNNWEKPVDKIFVFGKRVDDFRTVDYDRLFTLGISSIQELSRRVEQLEKENGILKSESKAFSKMKSEIAELRAMILK